MGTVAWGSARESAQALGADAVAKSFREGPGRVGRVATVLAGAT